MKKIIALLSAILITCTFAFGISGCGEKENEKKTDTKTSSVSKDNDKNNSKPNTNKDDDDKTEKEDPDSENDENTEHNDEKSPEETDRETLIEFIDAYKGIDDELNEAIEEYNDGNLSSEDILEALNEISAEFYEMPRPRHDAEWLTEEYEEYGNICNDAVEHLSDCLSSSIEAFEEDDMSLLDEANESHDSYYEYMNEVCELINY